MIVTLSNLVVAQNNLVGCKPYKPAENKSSVFSSWEVKNPLVELEVVLPDNQFKFPTGSKVYVRPFLDAPPWVRDVFTVGGTEVIMVPVEVVVASVLGTYAQSSLTQGSPINSTTISSNTMRFGSETTPHNTECKCQVYSEK